LEIKIENKKEIGKISEKMKEEIYARAVSV